MQKTTCPVCASPDVKCVISDATDHITGEPFQILGCNKCEVRFTYPVPLNMELYYPAKYRRYGPIVLSVLQAFYRFRVGKWAKIKSRPGSALEIGCGPGLMLDALRRKGWQVMGVERTEALAAYARDTLGLNVISGGLELIPKEPGFDLIILFNVLEHLSNPLVILEKCAARLKPDGFLVISVPNFESWQSCFSSRAWLHLDPPRHLIHFSKNSLANTLYRVNLTIHGTSFISYEHDPFGWVQSAINQILGSCNTLTRYLMGIEGFNLQVAISMVLGVLLAVPSVLLSMITWALENGALMEVVAVRSNMIDRSKTL